MLKKNSLKSPPVGLTNQFLDLQVEKNSYASCEKHLFYSCDCCPCFARASNFKLAKYNVFSLVAYYILFRNFENGRVNKNGVR